MNHWCGSGRLTKDPEPRYLQDGRCVCRMTLAVDDGYGDKRKTYFLQLVTWGKTAEVCGNNLIKGQQVTVEGKIVSDKYEKDGQTKYFTEISVARIEFGMRPKNAQPREAQAHGAQEESSHAASLPYEAPSVPDEEVPF